MTEKKKEQEQSVSAAEIGDGILQYYLQKVIEAKLPEVQRVAIKHNPHIDADYINSVIKTEAEKHIEELAYKMNTTALLIVDYLLAGQIEVLRDFESKFADLLERTLARGQSLAQMLSEVQKGLLEIFQQYKDQIPDDENTTIH